MFEESSLRLELEHAFGAGESLQALMFNQSGNS